MEPKSEGITKELGMLFMFDILFIWHYTHCLISHPENGSGKSAPLSLNNIVGIIHSQ